MAYEKYSTDALVCGSTDHLTSHRTYLLFTREAGMLRARADSVREERSKQRYALQDFSLCRVSLIKGRTNWKIAGTEPIKNVFNSSADRRCRTIVRDSVRFLRRFVTGEGKEDEIYDELQTLFHDLEMYSDIDQEKLWQVCQLRLLSYLGYIGDYEAYGPIITAADSQSALPYVDSSLQKKLVDAIEKAVTSSHL